MQCPSVSNCTQLVNAQTIESHFRATHPTLIMKSPRFFVTQNSSLDQDRLYVDHEYNQLFLIQMYSNPKDENFGFAVKYLFHQSTKLHMFYNLRSTSTEDDDLFYKTSVKRVLEYNINDPNDGLFYVDHDVIRKATRSNNFYFDFEWFNDTNPQRFHQPCINRNNGCPMNVFEGYKELCDHEDTCGFIYMNCPVIGSQCQQILLEDIKQHYTDKHSELFMSSAKFSLPQYELYNENKIIDFGKDNGDLTFLVKMYSDADMDRFGLGVDYLHKEFDGTLFYKFEVRHKEKVYTTAPQLMSAYKLDTDEDDEVNDEDMTFIGHNDLRAALGPNFVFQLIWWWADPLVKIQ